MAAAIPHMMMVAQSITHVHRCYNSWEGQTGISGTGFSSLLDFTEIYWVVTGFLLQCTGQLLECYWMFIGMYWNVLNFIEIYWIFWESSSWDSSWPWGWTLCTDSLRGSPVERGTVQRTLGRPMCKDGAHKSRSLSGLGRYFYHTMYGLNK